MQKIATLITLVGTFFSSFSGVNIALPKAAPATVAAPAAVVRPAEEPVQQTQKMQKKQAPAALARVGATVKATPQAVAPAKAAASAQAPAKVKTKNAASTSVTATAAGKSVAAVVSKRVATALPKHTYYNLHAAGSSAVFFAFDPSADDGQNAGGQNTGKPFGWYRMPIEGVSAEPELIASSEDIQLLFETALSPDGKELILTKSNGEIAVKDISKSAAGAASGVNFAGETIIGTYNSKYPTGEFSTYSFPVYSPDGKYLILHNRWENTLLVVDAKKKNIDEGRVAEGFWLEPVGGESPPSGTDVSVYDFSEDNSRVTFGKRQVLNLLTMRKE